MRLDPALVAKASNTEMRFLVDELNAYKHDSVDNCLKSDRETSDTRQMGRREQRRTHNARK